MRGECVERVELDREKRNEDTRLAVMLPRERVESSKKKITVASRISLLVPALGSSRNELRVPSSGWQPIAWRRTRKSAFCDGNDLRSSLSEERATTSSSSPRRDRERAEPDLLTHDEAIAEIVRVTVISKTAQSTATEHRVFVPLSLHHTDLAILETALCRRSFRFFDRRSFIVLHEMEVCVKRNQDPRTTLRGPEETYR